MTLLESLMGCAEVELTSADVARLLDLACQKGIHLRDVNWIDDLSVRILVSRPDYKRLDSLARKLGAGVRILNRRGLYWDAHNLLCRPLFLIGMMVMLLMGIFLPGRIYFVEVQGNEQVESARILEAASEFGITFGASRRLVRSEQVKNQLIDAIPELGWVGVNTRGCVAVISVREKVTQEAVSPDAEPGNIVAVCDGIILNGTATRGKLLCTVGQAVSEGDVLISGSGSFLDVDTVTGAAGEVFASTQRQISVVTPGFYGSRTEIQGSKVKFSIQIGKNLINFFKGSGISGGTCVKMYSKYVLTLPGGFTLPVTLIKWTTQVCDTASENISEADAGRLLSDHAGSYLSGQMIAGRILRKEEALTQRNGVYQLTGNYACTEMIGRAQKEQIGAYNGKTD